MHKCIDNIFEVRTETITPDGDMILTVVLDHLYSEDGKNVKRDSETRTFMVAPEVWAQKSCIAPYHILQELSTLYVDALDCVHR